MKKALYVIMALVLIANMYSTYSVAAEADENEDITNSFLEYVKDEQIHNEDEETNVIFAEQKASPSMATVDDSFVPGEVMIMLMREQSAARQEYTVEDFPGVDIKEISISFDYYPDINNRMILLLKLNKEDKQSVIETIKVLEKNPIVYAAEPNYIAEVECDSFIESTVNSVYSNDVYSNDTNEQNSYLCTYACCAKKYTSPNMNNAVKVGVIGVGIYNNQDISFKVVKYMLSLLSTITFAEENISEEESIIDEFMSLNDSVVIEDFEENCTEQKVHCTATADDEFRENEVLVVLSKEQSGRQQEYSSGDFPGMGVKNVSTIYDYYPEDKNNIILMLTLEENNKQNVIDVISALEQDERIISAEPNYIIIIQNSSRQFVHN